MELLNNPLLQSLVVPLAGGFAFALIGYALSRVLRRNDVADVLWGLGFIGLAFYQASISAPLSFRAYLAISFISLWGLRLSLYLGFRVFGKKEEDVRYAGWRKDWGRSEPWMAFLKVFALQGLMLSLISLPVLHIIQSPATPLTPWDFLGAVVFVIGWFFETIADAQLAQFKSKPKNKGEVMQTGLWALSRHPNYFGEILVWWGLFLLSLSLPGGLATVVSPLLITFLLTKVSGVPMLEKVLSKKGPAFKQYVKNTPALLPFRSHEVLVFFAIAGTLCMLDFLWLGVFWQEFYQTQAAPIARLDADGWDVLGWAAAGVYLFLVLGVRVLAVKKEMLTSLWYGAWLGLSAYGIYELTNLALVKDWPIEMALMDILWGPFLCAAAALAGSITLKRFS